MTFRPPICATCSHAQGDHQSSRGNPPEFGVCLRPGCTCRLFTAESVEDRQARMWLSEWSEDWAA